MTVANDKIIITMPPGHTFITFCLKHDLGKWSQEVETEKPFFELTFDEVHKLIDLKVVFDGTNGGLVLGKLHIDGGVHMINLNADTRTFKYLGEMEGWEYLSSPIIKPEIGKKLEKLNDKIKGEISFLSTEFRIPKNCKVIDTFDIVPAILILSNIPQFITNRFVTKKHIKRIIRLDRKNNS